MTTNGKSVKRSFGGGEFWAGWGVVVLYLLLCGLFFSPIAAPYKLVYPLAMLTIVSLWARNPLLTMALAFSALGDFMGAAGVLMLQIGAFAVAQICYLLLLLRQLPKGLSFGRIALAAALPLALCVVAIVGILPAVGADVVKVAVVIYALLIGSMTTTAFLSGSRRIMLGALLFMLSDFMLAFYIFVTPNQPLLQVSLVCYLISQLLLWLGLHKR